MPVKTARQISSGYGGVYELFDGEDYLRLWIREVDGTLPKEYQVTKLEEEEKKGTKETKETKVIKKGRK